MKLAKTGLGQTRVLSPTNGCLVVCACAYLLILCATNCLAEDRILWDLLESVKGDMEKLRARFDRLDRTLTVSARSFRHVGPENVLPSLEAVVKRSGDKAFGKTESKPGASICFCINSKYCFELQKKNNPSDPWVLSRLVLDPGPTFDSKKHGFNYPFRRPLTGRSAPTGIQDMGQRKIEPDKLVDLPGFALESIDTRELPDGIISIHFAYTSDNLWFPNVQKPVSAVVKTTLLLDKRKGHLSIGLRQQATHAEMEYSFDVKRELVMADGLPTAVTSNNVTKVTNRCIENLSFRPYNRAWILSTSHLMTGGSGGG